MKLYPCLFSAFLIVFFSSILSATINQHQSMQQFFQQQSSNINQLATLQQRFKQQQAAQVPNQQQNEPIQAQAQAQQPINQIKYQQRNQLFHAPQGMLKGTISIDKDHGKVPEFRVYCHGKQTMSNGEGFFSIPLDNETSTDEYFLLISKGLKQSFEKTNTVKNLILFTDKDHKFYALKKADNQSFSWEERNLSKDQKNFALPAKTVIIILNPQLIERIEPWHHVALPTNSFALPRIVLKANAKNAIKDASARSLLGGTMNLGSFHEPVKQKVQHFTKGACLLVQ